MRDFTKHEFDSIEYDAENNKIVLHWAGHKIPFDYFPTLLMRMEFNSKHKDSLIDVAMSIPDGIWADTMCVLFDNPKWFDEDTKKVMCDLDELRPFLRTE